MSVSDQRLTEYSQAEIQEYNLKRQREEARLLKPIPTSIVPPKGYYVSPEDQQKYKESAIEYNRKLIQYKRDLNKAWRQVRENKIAFSEYIKQRNQNLQYLQRTAPQRKAFYEYIKSIGPPEPTETQRKRQEAGLPPRGLPGPAAGPKPGSIGETLQGIVKQTVKTAELVPRTITDTLRETATTLERLSIESLGTQKPYQPGATYGTQPSVTMMERPLVETRGSPAVGALAYGYSVGFDVLAAGFDVATIESRPGLVAETFGSLISLGLDRETQQAFYQEAVGDPFRFMSTIVGGSFVGAEIQSMIPKAVSKVKQVYAAREWRKLGIDESAMSPFERELYLDYPEETPGFSETYRLFERKTVKQTYGKGVAIEWPYMLETDLETYIDPDVQKIMLDAMRGEYQDPWSPELIKTRQPTAIPYESRGEGGFLKTDGAYSKMKPMKYEAPKVEEIKASKELSQLLEPTKKGKTTTLLSGAFKGQKSWVTGYVEETVEFIPAINLRDTLFQAPQVNIPNLFPALPISAALSITGVTTKQQQKIKQTQDQRLKETLKLGDMTLPKIGDIQTPKSIQTPASAQATSVEQAQLQKPITTQIILPKMEPIQIPEMQPPDFTVPNIPLPPFQPKPRTTIKAKPTKKKKRKSGKKRKTAYEKRTDPLRFTFPKVKIPKVPKI